MATQVENGHVRLYVDENLSPRIAEQFRRRGIDAVSARDIDTLGASDGDHMARAAAMDRVLVTSDADFLGPAAGGAEHPGIVYGVQETHSIGDWVRSLEILSLVYSAGEMRNHVEYL